MPYLSGLAEEARARVKKVLRLRREKEKEEAQTAAGKT